MKKLFGYRCFGYAKPVSLLSSIFRIGAPAKDAIVLDFFSGSATTGHAVMNLNLDDQGTRQFILVQVQEQCSQKSLAYQKGFQYITDIGKARLRLCSEAIKKEYPLLASQMDLGFRVMQIK